MAWSSTTYGNNHVYATESVTVPDSEGASESSVNTSNLPVDVSNVKFYVGGTVTETSVGDGALNFRLQASKDGGTTWHTVDTASLDIDPTGANTDTDDLDASGWFFPTWRIQVFSDGVDTVDDSTLTVFFTACDLEVRTGAKKH